MADTSIIGVAETGTTQNTRPLPAKGSAVTSKSATLDLASVAN
ncbi:MAG TPA: hypothetical protein VJO35_02825 [Terriglobales bacterium]|nr:hypothetical protein [Terriglobales bacterium]